MVKMLSYGFATSTLCALFLIAVHIVDVTPALAVNKEYLGSTLCTSNSPQSYEGNAKLPEDNYDVYIKLDATSRSSKAKLITGSVSGSSCAIVGSAEASGKSWVKLGSLKVRNGDDVAFHLGLDDDTSLSGSGSPNIMLVSQTNPVCVPDRECITTIRGLQASVRPQNVSEGGTLKIGYAENLPLSEVEEMRLYADNELLYRSGVFEDYDIKIIPYYASRVIRVIEYKTGQQAVISQDVPVDREIDSMWILLAPMYKYKNIITVVTVIIGLLLGYLILKASLKAYFSRRRRLIHHGFIVVKPKIPFAYRHHQISSIARTIERVITRAVPFVIGGLAVLILGVGVSSYVVQLSKIEGSSMEMSFRPGQTALINKLPVTLARLNQSYFIPERGQVIVAYPNSTFSIDQTSEEVTVIKRVIGLPGERVVINRGQITIINDNHPDGFSPEAGAEWSENLIIDDEMSLNLDVRLTEDQLFIVGDNRTSSSDSRFNGPISANQLVGTVFEY